jgi:hypothetical protein
MELPVINRPPDCCSTLETRYLSVLTVLDAVSLVLEGREVASHQILPRTIFATRGGGGKSDGSF